jgi:hypothetical protein
MKYDRMTSLYTKSRKGGEDVGRGLFKIPGWEDCGKLRKITVAVALSESNRFLPRHRCAHPPGGISPVS